MGLKKKTKIAVTEKRSSNTEDFAVPENLRELPT